MRILFKNILRSVKGHPKENLSILINMILCMMTVFVLLQNYYFLKKHFDLVYGDDQVASHYIIEMGEKDKEAMYSDLLNHSPMYRVGKQVNKEIMNTPHLSLYYYSQLDVELGSFKDRVRFEKFSYLDEEAYKYHLSIGEDVDCRYVRAMSVSSNFGEVMKLSVMKGRLFDGRDQVTNVPDMPVPVVLGNDYAGSFDVGDVIELNGDSAVVIGILNDNMFISGYGTVEYLDNVILTVAPFIPRAFDLTVDDYEKFQVYDYVYCDDPSVDVQKTINRITAENGYYTYKVQPVDGIEISETKNISEKNVALIGLLALVACIICTSSLSSVLYNRSVQDRSIFCIYLCCGIPLWKINCSVVVEMALYLLISFIPTWILSFFEYKKMMVPVWQLLLFSGIIVTVSLIPVFKINKENNLDMLIRDRIV
jgi:hypothetical protein